MVNFSVYRGMARIVKAKIIRDDKNSREVIDIAWL